MNISSLIGRPPGTVFQITDEVLLEKFPYLRDELLNLSIAKRNGRKIYVQYNLHGTATTLKLIVDSYQIDIKDSTGLEPLISVIRNFKFADKKPSHVKISGEGEELIYKIDTEFWEQNLNNIYLKGLSRFGQKYKIPGAWIVIEKIFN